MIYIIVQWLSNQSFILVLLQCTCQGAFDMNLTRNNMYTLCHPVYSNSSKVSSISRSLASVFLLQDTDRAAVIYTRGCLDAVKEWFKENMIIIGGVAVGLALLQVIYFLENNFLTVSASQWHPKMLRSANGLKHLSRRELLLGSGLTWKMGS